jgi:hypothetical protein
VPTYFVETTAPAAAAQSSANLLASAPPDNSGDWENGLSFIGEGCPTLEIFDPCEETDTMDGTPGAVTFLSPLGYRLTSECTTLGVDLKEALARVTRQANAVASFALARELAEGAGTQAAPFDVTATGETGVMNPYFSDGNAEVLTAATSLLQGVGLLEQAARDKTKGQRVYLHIPIVIATQVAANLFKVGNEIQTATGAVVIADAGYTGKGPGVQAGTWGYATGPVFTRLSTVSTMGDPAMTIDRRTNRQQVWADALFVAGYDPCSSVAIKFP